jgi:hypothetical protein
VYTVLLRGEDAGEREEEARFIIDHAAEATLLLAALLHYIHVCLVNGLSLSLVDILLCMVSVYLFTFSQ